MTRHDRKLREAVQAADRLSGADAPAETAADRATAAAAEMFGCPPLGASDAPATADAGAGADADGGGEAGDGGADPDFTMGDAPTETLAELVVQIAKLPRLEYDQNRQAEADKLGVRVSTLDAEVARARGDGDAAEPGQGRALRIKRAEPWAAKVDGAELLDALAAFVRGHVFLPDGAADALAGWVVHTHCFTSFRHTPRVAFTSPEKQCGKTTELDTLELLVAAPLPTANITSAALFRTIELAKPTLLIDEADTFLGDNEDLRGAINAGHKRGGQVIRCVGDDAEPRAFSVFAPAAIAAIGKLGRLGTIEDRSIIVRMQRATRAERPAPLDAQAEAEGERLARMCARWCADHGSKLAEAKPVLPAALFNRTADNWRALFAIAEAAGDGWPERLTTASTALAPDDDDEGRGIRLLADIKTMFDARNVDVIASADLTKALVAIEGAPWAELNQGKPLTQNRLARLLHPYRLAPMTVRIGEGTIKGYKRDGFADAWHRYLTEKPGEPADKPSHRHNPQKTANSRTSKPSQAESRVTDCDGEKPQSPAACDGVTVGYPVLGESGAVWETEP